MKPYFRCRVCQGEATLAKFLHESVHAFTPENSEGVIETKKRLTGMSCASELCENAWDEAMRTTSLSLKGDGDRAVRVDERFELVGAPESAEVAE